MATKKKTVEAVTTTSSPMVSMLRQAAGVEELTAIGNTDELVSNAMTVGEPTVVTIDSALSTTSTNPVQNKIVTAAINTNTANISTNTEDITSLKSAKGSAIFETATGSLVSVDDGADSQSCSSIVVDIDYSADGYTEANLTRTGKNLVVYDNIQNGEFISGSNTGIRCSIGTEIKQAGTYTFWIEGGSNSLVTDATRTVWLQIKTPSNSLVTTMVFAQTVSSDYSLSFVVDSSNIGNYIVLTFGSQISSNWQTITKAEVQSWNSYLALESSFSEYSDGDGTIYSVDWSDTAGTIYGGSWDVTNGIVTSTYDSDGTELDTAVEYSVTAQEVTTLLGDNNIWADTGDVTVTYPADTKTYIDNAIAAAIA